MLGSNCNLKTHVQNLGIPSPYKLEAPKSPFWTTLQLNGNFNGVYLRMKHDIDNRASAYTRGLLHCLSGVWGGAPAEIEFGAL